MKAERLSGVDLQPAAAPPHAPDDSARIFEATWDRPPEFSSMRRPGIVRVEGDRVILDGTTLEEFEKHHRDTLKLVLAETNRKYDETVDTRRRQKELRRAREDQHRREVEARARQINFDDF